VRSITHLTLALVLGGGSLLAAQTEVPLTVTGNEARASIALPGGVGAELTIAFESVVGLNPAALGVSAGVVNPLDLTLLSRLPAGGQVAIAGAFPLLVSIEPTASSALSFAGVVSVSLYTHNLQLQAGVPLALYSAPAGGPFRDITTSEGRGSYRAGGSSGSFSEFMIVVDGRPIDAVIISKFDALQAALAAHSGSIPSSVAGHLQGRLSQARALYEAGATVAAIGELSAFSAYVKAKSGADIPDVWRANDTSVVNVAGLLRAGADSLRFSLDRKTAQ
jgi:hypothetical protein